MNNQNNCINFGGGPAKLPREVLEEIQTELLNFSNTQMSICELSHRSQEFIVLINEAQQLTKELLKIPSNYEVLFLHGGGKGMFAAVPMNLIGKTGTADYLVNGYWSKTAAEEATKYGNVNLVYPKTEQYLDIPSEHSWNLNPNASYVYYCDNETVNGIEYPFVPQTNGLPIVVDMSSNIMSKNIDVSKFGVIIAGAQKNVGIAGMILVICRKDLFGNVLNVCPTVWNFEVQSREMSLYNTPPMFPIYLTHKVFKWIKKNGGVERMEELSKQKSELVYETIDKSNGFYWCPIKREFRSRMNVPFRIIFGEELEKCFLKEAEEMNMKQLKGHRSVGGIRVSLYNAITLDEVKVFVDFMKKFQQCHHL